MKEQVLTTRKATKLITKLQRVDNRQQTIDNNALQLSAFNIKQRDLVPLDELNS